MFISNSSITQNYSSCRNKNKTIYLCWLIFEKASKTIQCVKYGPFNKWCCDNWISTCKRMWIPKTIINNNTTWISNLNIRSILSSNLWGKTFSYFNLCSLLTLRRKCDGQNGDSKEKHEERLAYLTAQVIQCQKCNIIGWEVDCTKKNLEQENIAPYVLEVENQAKKGHEVCKSVVNKNERHLS